MLAVNCETPFADEHASVFVQSKSLLNLKENSGQQAVLTCANMLSE